MGSCKCVLIKGGAPSMEMDGPIVTIKLCAGKVDLNILVSSKHC